MRFSGQQKQTPALLRSTTNQALENAEKLICMDMISIAIKEFLIDPPVWR